MEPQWQFCIDRGGTFTDVVARSPDGVYHTRKLLSENPEQYVDAALEGIRQFLGGHLDAARIESVKMGTTVATNALLERRGEPTVLVTTEGFADALRIGYQNRPRIFDLNIVLPEPLYTRVLEVPERLDANGAVQVPLDREATRQRLQAAYAAGLRACAIVLMHGYRNPLHEEAVAELARQVGFTQVSLSSVVSPLMKLVSRGDTTVVDAYVSPVLRRYVDRVAGALGGARLLFMQSNGGLVDASHFAGKDSILSGPAGGIVGAAGVARQAGLERVVTFDMGGTSTDVALYNGDYERTLDTQVAGVRVRVPMMHIHTVAAGGGSVLHFTNMRTQVGPDSAGANPGPACYRRGGPLTVTDCNALLGRIQPSYFPKVFGPQGTQPLDTDVVRRQLSELAAAMAQETGQTRTPEAVAAGFLQVAVQNIASAIKHISTQRGHDVTAYTLCTFGGAGGQHACAVADALGMTQVLVPAFTGVLSAHGMGLADLRLLNDAAVEAPLAADTLAAVAERFAPLEAQARAHMQAQGVAPPQVRFVRRLQVRAQGSDTALLVPWGDLQAVQAAFDAAHRDRYGFAEARALVVESLSLETVGTAGVGAGPARIQEPAAESLAPVAEVAMYQGTAMAPTPVYERARLPVGQPVEGPALVCEADATTVVEAGWQARRDAHGHLLLRRTVALQRPAAAGTQVDPVLLEVFNNLFMAIAEQMGATLENTAQSVNIKERLDFSCAIFDAAGALVANAPHVPVHLGSMGESVLAVLRAHGDSMQPGDVFALNDPYHGGTHLPDITVVTPVFDAAGSKRLFYVASRGHHGDIGGKTPGSMPPDSTSVQEEGILLDAVKLVAGGVLQEADLLRRLGEGPYPSRNPAQNLADLRAQIAANAQGVRQLRAMVDRYGLGVVHNYMGHVQDNAEESVRRALAALDPKQGPGKFTSTLDDGSVIAVRIAVDPAARAAVIDFTGTSPQRPSNLNAPRAVCMAAVLYVFRTLVGSDIPLNAGCLKPLQVIIPKGSMLDPVFPAAVVAGNVETSQCVVDALYGALGVLAGSQGTMNNFTFGDATYQYYETLCGGAGAGPTFAGADAVHTHMTNSRLTDPEVLEWRFPVVLDSFTVRRGSGGPGLHGGGAGIARRLRFLRPMTAAIVSNNRLRGAHGMHGGQPGQPGRNSVQRADGTCLDLGPTAQIAMQPQDVFIIETPGGGGYGNMS